jgi:hypothetical protein
MDPFRTDLHLPPDWSDALAEASARRRVLVLGATDMGKTSFIRAFLEGQGGGARLIDLDPGQKMIGPPGTVALGRLGQVEQFVFIGTTSASALSAIARAAEALAQGSEPFIVNTSGFVKGIGARLQAMTVKAIQPDLILELGSEPIVAAASVPVLGLQRSPLARRKSPAFRAALRQAAFEREIEGSSVIRVAQTGVDRGPMAPWRSAARPVCGVADADGTDMALGIVEEAEEGVLRIRTRAPSEAVRLVRLGKMWAEPKEGRWRLLDKLSPAWVQS